MVLLIGMESIVGLLLIGWSATFTYLEMKELWPLHGSKARRRKPAPASPD